MKLAKSQDGFTLIEVLMATVILSVGFLALAAMTMAVINGNARANKVTVATALAQEKVEEIRQRPFAAIVDEPEPYGSIANYDWARRDTTVSDDTPEADVKTIQVAVSIKDSQGGDKTLAAFTVLKSQ